MMPLWVRFSDWVASKGGWSHLMAGIYGGAIGAYAAVPAFHKLVIDAWAKTPTGVIEVLSAAAGIYALYRNPEKHV
jgi:hypothetical protein